MARSLASHWARMWRSASGGRFTSVLCLFLGCVCVCCEKTEPSRCGVVFTTHVLAERERVRGTELVGCDVHGCGTRACCVQALDERDDRAVHRRQRGRERVPAEGAQRGLLEHGDRAVLAQRVSALQRDRLHKRLEAHPARAQLLQLGHAHRLLLHLAVLFFLLCPQCVKKKPSVAHERMTTQSSTTCQPSSSLLPPTHVHACSRHNGFHQQQL